jgi:hypothetical protein
MRNKSLALLLIFCFSLIPFRPSQADAGLGHSLDDALLMMYLSDAILSGEADQDLTSLLPLLASLPAEEPNPDLDDTTLAAALQALKNLRNDLDTNCRLLISKLRAEGKDCEADRVEDVCAQRRNEINSEIGKYHDLRGDKRKVGTRIWHFLKRNGRTIWQKIGPIGRNFLRRLGPEALQVVASGGSLSGGVLKKLIKNVARSMGRDRIKKVVFQGVERLLKGQIAILQAAGVDICDPDAQLANEQEGQSNTTSDGTGEIPDGTRWECADVAGPVAYFLETRPTMEGVKTNYYEFDHWLIYGDSPPALHYFYSYDYSEEWYGALFEDGSVGWETCTWSGKAEDTSVFLDENGIFTVTLTWNEKRTDYDAVGEVSLSRNRWGLIPVGNYQTVYICDWGMLDMPTGLETLTAENFRDRCGQGRYYFECYLSGE